MVVFVVKYGALYGGIPDSEQLGTNTIWGYPEYGASNCVRHMVSPGLDGLKLKDDSLLARKYSSRQSVFQWIAQGKAVCLHGVSRIVFVWIRTTCPAMDDWIYRSDIDQRWSHVFPCTNKPINTWYKFFACKSPVSCGFDWNRKLSTCGLWAAILWFMFDFVRKPSIT